jgi:hypothetical protein
MSSEPLVLARVDGHHNQLVVTITFSLPSSRTVDTADQALVTGQFDKALRQADLGHIVEHSTTWEPKPNGAGATDWTVITCVFLNQNLLLRGSKVRTRHRSPADTDDGMDTVDDGLDTIERYAHIAFDTLTAA